MTEWRLEDVSEAARERPDTFFIPSLEERLAVEPGRQARLHFLLESPSPDQPRAERMWVEVEERVVSGDDVAYVGVLTNEPAFIRTLVVGDRVSFGPQHVAQLILPADHPSALDIGEKLALVSVIVLEPGGVARFAYREGPDNAKDSGWRLFAAVSAESDVFLNDPQNVRACNVYWLRDRDPSLDQVFRAPEGQAFERRDPTLPWRRVLDWEGPEE